MEIKNVMLMTTYLDKHTRKLRQRWMKVNKHLSIQYKTGKLINRLRLYEQNNGKL